VDGIWEVTDKGSNGPGPHRISPFLVGAVLNHARPQLVGELVKAGALIVI
jgi:hypothetical protein